jgi:hypothetical protein
MTTCDCPNGSYGKKHSDKCNALVRVENERLRTLLGEARNYLEGLEIEDRIDAALGAESSAGAEPK